MHSLADSVTAVFLALLSLLAVGVVLLGIYRAARQNRRPQVVVADLVAPASPPAMAEGATLSPVMRQFVEQQIDNQRSQAGKVGDAILAPASLELRWGSQLRDRVQNAVSDSLDTLTVALRAIAPDRADPLTGLFSVLLPPRGRLVTVTLLRRGDDTDPRLGVAVDIASLRSHSLSAALFWENADRTPSGGREGINERFLLLMEPAARWIAIQLIVMLTVSPAHRVQPDTREGMTRLLTGGLFLAAMRDYSAHALTFGDVARTELECAQRLMPDTPLLLTTLAGVRERMGWAYRSADDEGEAVDNFCAAVGLWRRAAALVRDRPGADADVRQVIISDRILKAQLISGDDAFREEALRAVAALSSQPIPGTLLANKTWLYNRACVYAQASTAGADASYKQKALIWLGLSLALNRLPEAWDYAERRDSELEPLREAMTRFLANLRTILPADSARLNHAEAEALVSRALARSQAAG